MQCGYIHLSSYRDKLYFVLLLSFEWWWCSCNVVVWWVYDLQDKLCSVLTQNLLKTHSLHPYIFVRSSYLFALEAIHFSELYCFVFQEFRTTSNSALLMLIKTTFKTRKIAMLIFREYTNILRKLRRVSLY